MIPCNEINQTANEILGELRKCKPVTNENVIQLTELIIAIGNCSEGGGINSLIPNWEDGLYLQEFLVFHNNSIWRNDCEEVTGEPGIDACWTLISEINEDILWEEIVGDQSQVKLSGFDNDLNFAPDWEGNPEDYPTGYPEGFTVYYEEGNTKGIWRSEVPNNTDTPSLGNNNWKLISQVGEAEVPDIDAVLFTVQVLTPEQQEQARENIGAVVVNWGLKEW